MFELAFKHWDIDGDASFRQLGLGAYSYGEGFSGDEYYCHDRLHHEALI